MENFKQTSILFGYHNHYQPENPQLEFIVYIFCVQ